MASAQEMLQEIEVETITGVKTFSANPAITVGNTIKSNVQAVTGSSHAGTTTGYWTQYTTETLSTAAGSSQAEAITLTGVAATDIAFVSPAGGTNTENYLIKAVCTTNTVTVTITNIEPTDSLDGTIIFNLMVLKA